MFIRFDDGSLIMVTWMAGRKEIHRMEAEMDARHFFDNVSGQITGDRIFTPEEWGTYMGDNPGRDD